METKRKSTEDADVKSDINTKKIKVVPKIGFIGLGAMGFHIAGHLTEYAQKLGGSCTVYNRTASISKQHSGQFGSIVAETVQELASCSVIFCCLPTSQIVTEILTSLPMQKGTIAVDCTSGDPIVTKDLATQLLKKEVQYVDCPISGGPAGAKAGTLTGMIGGSDDAVSSVSDAIKSFTKVSAHVGVAGSGHAVKAVNNALNASHLAMASEGLIALVKAGVKPATALSVINSSSGRSLQTEVRIPQDVLTRRFNYGFKVGLMHKDVKIAQSLIGANLGDVQDSGVYFNRTANLLGATVDKYGHDADYTSIARVLEDAAGQELKE